MALNTTLSPAAVKASVDAVVDLVSVGTAAAAKIVISDTAQPASPGAGTPNALATIPLGTASEADIFDAATTDTATSYISASLKAALGTPSDTSATGAGTAVSFRAYDSNGLAIIDGSVGTATADLILDNDVIATGQAVKLTAWKVRQQFK